MIVDSIAYYDQHSKISLYLSQITNTAHLKDLGPPSDIGQWTGV